MESNIRSFIEEIYATEKMAVETYTKVLKLLRKQAPHSRQLMHIRASHLANLNFWKSRTQDIGEKIDPKEGIWRSIQSHLLREDTSFDFNRILGGLISGEKMSRSRYLYSMDLDGLHKDVKLRIQKVELPTLTQNIQVLKGLASFPLELQIAN